MEFRKSHKNFRELYIACKYVPASATGYALNCLNVTKKHIEATDGRKAIRVKNLQELPVGKYRIVKCTKTLIDILPDANLDGIYPKFDDIFPLDDKGIFVDNLVYDDTVLKTLSILAYKLARVETGIDITHAKPMADIQAEFEYFVIAPDRPIFFENPMAEAVIMPYNTK